MAVRHRINVEIALSDRLVLSTDVLATPVECLQNPAASFGRPLDGIDPRAVALATLRETAGPFVAFLEDGAGGAQEASRTGLEAGRYGPGRGDRKSVVSGKSVSVRVDLGGRSILNKNT